MQKTTGNTEHREIQPAVKRAPCQLRPETCRFSVSSRAVYAFQWLVTTYLGSRPRVSGNVEDKTTGDEADKCHQMEGKAPAIHSKGHHGANVSGKEPANHATLSTTEVHLCQR